MIMVEAAQRQLGKVSGDGQRRRAGQVFQACRVKVSDSDGSGERDVPVTFQLQGAFAAFVTGLTAEESSDALPASGPVTRVTVETGPDGTCSSPAVRSFKGSPGVITVKASTDSESTDFTLTAGGNTGPA
ncbi:hypothetical protein [Streptomyces lavendulae]|uniref:hypothetical protein n=1 Tax=Streptomyces lavendulae TaxID=1914 RepID=UPI00380A4A85